MPKELSTLQSKTGTRSSRVLSILDLFTVEAPRWTVDMMAGRVAIAPATVYRYVRDLCTAGFLVQAAGGGYVLGPLLRVGPAVEIDPDLVGVAAPIFRAQGTVVASLCMVRLRKEATGRVLAILEEKARAGAAKISKQLQKAASTAVPSYASAHQPR